MAQRSILLIYTGGTIGMRQDPVTLTLRPFDFSQISEEVPELKKFGYSIDTYSFDPIIDSSDVNITFWVTLAQIIERNYNLYDGFVILHGTDTMSYSASALSFMLGNLEKPVVFTGSQLPIGVLRTDGKENLISSIEIAAATRQDGKPMVPEVSVFFENELYRGNRTSKYNAENFRAFISANYPPLADIGIHIKYNQAYINYPSQWGKKLCVNKQLDSNIAIVRIIPSLSKNVFETIIHIDGLRAVILETFGSGNAPTDNWFINDITQAVRRGIIFLNITQCQAGKVNMDTYATGQALKNAGVISGYDCTIEAAVAKLYFLLGQCPDNRDVTQMLAKNICGEIDKE